MADNSLKVVAIEALRVDIKFGPDDKTERLFNLAFSFKDDTPVKWDINVKFAAFQELNKVIHHAGPNFISTEFPKAHRSRAALGMKLPQDKLDQRRNILALWFREVIANYDLLSEVVQRAIVEFIKAPPEFKLKFSTRDLIRANTPPPADGGEVKPLGVPTRRPSSTGNTSTRPSSSRSARNSFTLPTGITSATLPEGEGTALEQQERPKNFKVYDIHSIFLYILELVEMLMDACSDLHTSTTVNKVLCISRREITIKQSIKPIGRLFFEDLFSVYFFGCYFLIICVIFASAKLDDYYDGTLAVRLLYISVTSLCIMLFKDQYDLHIENIRIQNSNCQGYDPLQFAVDEFIQSSTTEIKYHEYLAPFSGLIVPAKIEDIEANPILTEKCKNLFNKSHTPGGALLKSFSSTFTKQKSKDIGHKDGIKLFPSILNRSSSRDEEHINSNVNTSNTSNGHNSKALKEASIIPESLSEETQESAKQKKIAARKAFDEFEFTDLSPAAKAMFIDRKFTHNFQLRGANYLTDKRKIHPGSALFKLMLLELYEVESKDGDRHDHIAERGLCKTRRETISNLPGNPFQLIINFQIPGDPPVSIVTYFAVPPDLADRYGEGELDAFQSLFGRFINLPVNECERLATWGVATKKSSHRDDGTDANTTSTEGHLSGAESEGEEVHTASNSPEKPGGWMKMPSDITWPDPHEPGALPQSDFRNMRFKLVPSVTEGPWVVKTAVRSQPALLGRKVVQRYFRGEGYMEIDIHVGSSVIASQIVGVCRGYAKMFAADVGIVIQGEDPSELPEKMLGCVSFHKIDLEVRQKLGG